LKALVARGATDCQASDVSGTYLMLSVFSYNRRFDNRIVALWVSATSLFLEKRSADRFEEKYASYKDLFDFSSFNKKGRAALS
jgi:hypothetical protein